MQTNKRALRRLNILYFTFFSIIVIGVIVVICSSDFQTGFKEGFAEGQQLEKGHPVSGRSLYELPVVRKEKDIIFHPLDSTLTARGRIASVDITFQGKSIPPRYVLSWGFLLQLASLACYAGIFIIIFIILSSLKRSIKNKDMFNRGNIMLTRAIGFLLIIATIAVNAAAYLECREAAQLLAGSDLEIAATTFDFSGIITGLLILVIAEIFAIGYDITEEQKFTI